MFERLTLEGWRQFQAIDIEFHPRLTVLTGANGSGKTTVLNILNRHFGWAIEFISTPTRDTSAGILRYVTDLWATIRRLTGSPSPPPNAIGAIQYTQSRLATLVLPDNVSQVYNLSIQNQVAIKGLHVPSHRPALTYQSVSQIPTAPQTRGQLISRYFSEMMSHYRGSGGRSPNYSLKEALISFAVFGYGNQAVSPNLALIETFEGFQRVLRRVLPPVIGFERLEIQVPEVLLVTTTGTFSFDAVSGGVAALIDLAWQIYMYSADNDAFVVTIDEPENHLHPQMQRAILPSFLDAFPNVQFIVATHNPFIVGSVPESNVYVLRFNESNRVESVKLDWLDRSGSANEVLRDVLGVPVTLPLWVEAELEDVARTYSERHLDETALSDIKADLSRLGLSRLLPESLERTLRQEAQRGQTPKTPPTSGSEGQQSPMVG